MDDARYLSIIRETVGDTSTTDTALLNKPIEAFQLDSLDKLEFLMNLEEGFEVELPLEALDESMSFQALAQIIESQISLQFVLL